MQKIFDICNALREMKWYNWTESNARVLTILACYPDNWHLRKRMPDRRALSFIIIIIINYHYIYFYPCSQFLQLLTDAAATPHLAS